MNRDVITAAVLAAALAWVTAGGPVRAAASSPSLEHDVKAAFVLQLLSFIDWPAENAPRDSIVVHVVGRGPMHDALVALRGEQVGPFFVAVHAGGVPSHGDKCQVLFIDCASAAEASESLRLGHATGTLSIANCPGFAAQGGMINLVVVDSRVGFEVNPDAVARGGVKISSKVLRLAKIVRKGD
jgi:hypothetical protein